MLNTKLIFNIFYAQLGNHTHVGISSDSSVTLLVTHPDFLSAVRKIDHNKHLSIFQRHHERTDDETAMLNQAIECMHECPSVYFPTKHCATSSMPGRRSIIQTDELIQSYSLNNIILILINTRTNIIGPSIFNYL